jgi:N4-gp56 family major capsid protein
MFNFVLSFLGFGADVMTVTSGTAGNSGSTAAELITYMSSKLLDVAELVTVLDQFGDKEPLPSNSSKTIRFVREEKLTPIANNTQQLSEAVAPDAVGLTLNQFEATVEQYGTVVALSDLAELTARHAIVARSIYLLGLQAAESYDQLIFNVLDAATSTYYPNNRANDTALLGTDVIGYVDLVELGALMSEQGARPFESGDYVYVTAPQVYAALLKDPDFKAAHQLVNVENIYKGQVDSLAGLRVVRSNAPAFAAVTSSTAGQSNKIYSSFLFGRSSYQITDLQNMRIYVAAPGGQSDPLQQRRKIGWKFAFKAIITNQNWMRRVRSSGASSVTN